jgi:pimeloyl-ACP methyl ester carboxylesterase
MKNSCLLIPGNPSVENYYIEWVKEIEQSIPNTEAFFASSYVIFSKKLNYIEYDNEMRNHYEKILLNHFHGEPITIIAHSVGSYFALRLLEKHADKIKKIIIMFPYIGDCTVGYVKYLYPIYIADRFLPISEFFSVYKNILFRHEKEVQNISSENLNMNLRFGVRQCIYFNKKLFKLASSAFTKDKIDFIYSIGDAWCPQETIELLKPLSNYKEVQIPHDFIIDKQKRQEMIKEIAHCL